MTAGHVDHGKSTLVRALTGVDPDRLPEERRRQMTIELGFASIHCPDGNRLSFIDVPGHERLIETMVAGVGSVDAALLVVAADDGPMPQTIEHLRILRLLGVDELIVAITRTDLVDDDWLELAMQTTRQSLIEHGFGHANSLPVSAVTGDRVEDLRRALLAIPPRQRDTGESDVVWLPVDRAFHLHGIGTVVAGTLGRGRLRLGDTLTTLPDGPRWTVRQLQSHHQPVDSVSAGQRVAVNLAGIGLDQIGRGNVLSNRPVPAIDAVDIWFDPIGPRPKSGSSVRVMVGTDRVDATIQFERRDGVSDRDSCVARLRFRRPVATAPGDRLIVRRPSPAMTVGGGVVLARYAGRPPRFDAERRAELGALAAGDPEPTLRRRLSTGPTSIDLAIIDLPEAAASLLRRWRMDGTVSTLTASPVLMSSAAATIVTLATTWQSFIRDLVEELTSCHAGEPEAVGMPLVELRRRSRFSTAELDDLLECAVREGHVERFGGSVALPGHHPRLRASQRLVAGHLLRTLEAEPAIQTLGDLDVPWTTVDFLERNGSIVRIGNDRIMSATHFERFASSVLEACRSRPLDLPTARDRLELGRDTVQRLLEHLDRMGLTTRNGDGRRPGPAAGAWLHSRIDGSGSPIDLPTDSPDRGIIATRTNAISSTAPDRFESGATQLDDRKAGTDMAASSSHPSRDPVAPDRAIADIAGPHHHVVLSPHYDDMALSIGATMAAVADAGREVTDLIVFGAEPAGVELHAFARHHHDVWRLSTNEVISARKAEEAAAVRLLGAITANLDFHDAIYRSDYYQSDAALFGTPYTEEADLPDQIAAAADALARGLADSTEPPVDSVRFYAPIGIGNHVDHQTAFLAAKVLSTAGYVVWLYEDLPYAMIGDNRADRLAMLADMGHALHIAALGSTAAGWQRKIDAVLAYPSQLETVFRNYAGVEPTADGIAEALSSYHRTVGAGTSVERFWAFDREPR